MRSINTDRNLKLQYLAGLEAQPLSERPIYKSDDPRRLKVLDGLLHGTA